MRESSRPKTPWQVSRTVLDAAGESDLPWSDQWPLVKKAFDRDTAHTSGLSSLKFFWKGLSVLLWIRYPYTVVEWAVRKATIHLLETQVNHKGQGKQTLSQKSIQRISLTVSDCVTSALLNPIVAVRNRLVLQPAGYNYCFGMFDGVFRLIQEEGPFIPGAATVALSRAIWHVTHWTCADVLDTLSRQWGLESFVPASLDGAAEGLFQMAPAVLADSVTYPLVTIRTRQHLLSDYFAPASLTKAKQTAFRGIFQTANAIVRSEGLVGLYRGLLADLAGSAIRFYAVKRFYAVAQRFVAWQKASPSMNDNRRWWLQFGIAAAYVVTLLAVDTAPQLESLRSFVYA